MTSGQVGASASELLEGQFADTDFAKLAHSEDFVAFWRKRRRFTFTTAFLIFVFYIMQPVLTAFTNVLTVRALGSLSWGWIYCFAQFGVVGATVLFYLYKAQQYDAEAATIKRHADVRKNAPQ